MVAYNTVSLDNKTTVEQAENALQKRFITSGEFKSITDASPVNLYRPNLFIRIGLFLATAVIVFMSFGLLALFLGAVADSEAALAVIIGIFALGVYAGLEYIIREKKHYRSGVDDALLWLSFSFVACDLLFFMHLSELAGSFLILILSLYGTIRFANSVMAAVVFLSFLSVIFFSITPLGTIAKIILPFLTMVISAAVYWLAHSGRNDHRWRHYRYCLMMIEFLALIATYASVNYFVVRELSISMFDLPHSTSISGSSFFWAATFVIPGLYIWRALQTKDRLLLRTGLLLVAAAISTFRAYYSLAPVEEVMTVIGIVTIAASYFVIKYLQKPRKGIVDMSQTEIASEDHLHVEGLVISETLSPETVVDQGFRFGGGSTGGGGASGNF